MRALSGLADVAGFWTLDRTTITGRSAVILRQHTTPFRPMIVPFDDLELVYQSLRISARECAGVQIGPHSTLRRERFFRERLKAPEYELYSVGRSTGAALLARTETDIAGQERGEYPQQRMQRIMAESGSFRMRRRGHAGTD
jgi:hypothetical protein